MNHVYRAKENQEIEFSVNKKQFLFYTEIQHYYFSMSEIIRTTHSIILATHLQKTGISCPSICIYTQSPPPNTKKQEKEW